MKLANLGGRAILVVEPGSGIDIDIASGGRFGPDPQTVLDDWDAFRSSLGDLRYDGGNVSFAPWELGPPVPRPTQVFAIGVNYREHAEEAGYPPDSLPVTFTKFSSCLTGPEAEVLLPTDTVDWEVELVVAIGRGGRNVSREEAWDHVAGVTVGQDLSERISQMEGSRPQYSLGKSFAGFGPIGPWLVTPDELPNRDDLEIKCGIGDETLQLSRTSQMIYDVPELIARLSAVCALLPGDLIFTGTPSGVGNARNPKRFLTPEDVLVSSVEGIGTIRTSFRHR